ncbi:metal-dependent protein hydrolase [Phlebopus sp. FC_14]|nr:metal-dependent protein hydrolase [Phlebopus sp. FC_14]
MCFKTTIGTHNGTFHCDEALAVYLLRLTPAYRNAELKRTRDPSVLDTCDVVVDVGAIYDDTKKRFDHHQRGFQDVFGHGFTTKLSSAGLIYKYAWVILRSVSTEKFPRHFGREIVAQEAHLKPEDPKVTILWLKIYKEFIEAIDAIDNGISQYSSQHQPKYIVKTDLSSRVAWLNPPWNVPADAQLVDSLFAKASRLTGEEFLGRLQYYAHAWLPARDMVLASLTARQNVDASGRILLFEQFAPWKEHLFDLEVEQEVAIDAQPLYVIYPDETSNNWRVQAVPVSAGSFESRKALPAEWRGLRDDELSSVSGIDGCIFVHASGFIGGHKTKEGALTLARLALTV